jgi:proline iminopeptidase
VFSLTLGEGPLRVMLHGGPGASHDYLRPQLDAIGGRLFYYDQRGSGQSPGGPVGWREHVEDLEQIRHELSVEKMTLVGYSWGSLLAMLYALEHADRVEKMVLLSPAPAAARERAETQRRMTQKRDDIEALRAKLDLKDRRNRFALAVAGYFYDPSRALELTPFLVQQRAEQAVWSSLGDYDLRPRLRSLEIPTLVVHGRQDPIPIETARATAEALRADLFELERCGHVPYVEGPQLFPVVRAFLAGH